MHHTLFTIPGLGWEIPSYGFMMMLGFLTAIWWATRRATRSQANPDVILNCGFVALIAGVVGARLMYVVHYWERVEVPGDTAATIMNIVNVRQGGLEFYGGFILATVVTLLYLVLWRHSVRWYLDIMAPSAMVGLAFGRTGCFLNGCCWGGVCSLPWAVAFPAGSPAATQHWVHGHMHTPPALVYTSPDGQSMPLHRDSLAATAEEVAAADAAEAAARAAYEDVRAQYAGDESAAAVAAKREAARKLVLAEQELGDIRAVMDRYGLSLAEVQMVAQQYHSAPVHPTQLYSVVAAVLLALLLDQLYWRRKRDGVVIFTLLAIQPVARYLLEVIRSDNPVDTFGFTISQAIALALTVIGLGGLILIRYLPPRSPRARAWEPPPDAGKKKNSAPASAGG